MAKLPHVLKSLCLSVWAYYSCAVLVNSSVPSLPGSQLLASLKTTSVCADRFRSMSNGQVEPAPHASGVGPKPLPNPSTGSANPAASLPALWAICSPPWTTSSVHPPTTLPRLLPSTLPIEQDRWQIGKRNLISKPVVRWKLLTVTASFVQIGDDLHLRHAFKTYVEWS